MGREEGEAKARSKGLSFCETSAKTGQGIEELFHSIIENILISKEGPKEVEELKLEHKSHSNSEGKINKAKIVEIGRRKQFPCCYI